MKKVEGQNEAHPGWTGAVYGGKAWQAIVGGSGPRHSFDEAGAFDGSGRLGGRQKSRAVRKPTSSKILVVVGPRRGGRCS